MLAGLAGKRYQCLDCPERVGFDLCVACYERRSNVHGRFNQHHTAGQPVTLALAILAQNTPVRLRT